MSRHITIKGFVYEQDYGFTEKSYALYHSENASDAYNTLVGPAQFSFTLPDDYDPVLQKVKALQKERTELQAAFAKRLMEINDDISKLTCIESAVQS